MGYRSVLTLALLGALLCRPAGAAVLHVSPQGKPGAPGTEAAPLGSVQDALDRARAGDTVRVRSGVYRERVSFEHGGTHGKPVVLEGEPGAILDGSEPVSLEWQPAPDVAPGAYRARVEFYPFTVAADGKIVTALREDRVDPAKVDDPKWHWPNIFRDGVGPSGWEGVKALALYLPGKKDLLLRFGDNRDPRQMAITVAPREACVHIAGVDRCVVRGLALRNAAYGVLIEDSLGSVVERCIIGPTDYGVWLGDGTDRCTVRFSEIFMNPYAGADPRGKGAWDNWQAHKRGGHYDRYGVQIRNTIGGHEIHDNDIHDTWDGIEDVGRPGQNRGLRIHHNRISVMSDDGLEPNGAEEDCRWHDNVVERCICGFRIKAPTVGPLYAYRNIFLNNSEDYRNYGEVELKPAAVYVYHNTSTSRPGVSSNKVFGIGTPNYHYFNNLFWCTYPWMNSGKSVPPNWKGDHNVWVRRDDDRRWAQTREALAQCGLDRGSLWLEAGDPGFADAEGGDLSLKPESPARGRGADLSRLLGRPLPGCEPGYFRGKAPDAGAIPFGSPMPRIPRKPEEVKAAPAGTWPDASADVGRREEAQNLLANGSFEQGFEGWGKPDAALYQVKGARSGDRPQHEAGDRPQQETQQAGAADGSAYLAVTAGEKRTDLHRVLSGLEAGKPYVLAYRSRKSTFADLRVIIRDPNGGRYLANASAMAGPRWRRTVLHFVPTGPTVNLEISPRSPGACELGDFRLSRER